MSGRESGSGIVLLDLTLPDRDGLDLMADMLALRPETVVIVITACMWCRSRCRRCATGPRMSSPSPRPC